MRASKQVKSLAAASSRLNTKYKEIFHSIPRSSLSSSILSTALPSCAYFSTSKSRTSQQDYAYPTLTRLQETTLLPLHFTPLSFHHYKMTFFGKNTIVRKVVASIKKEVSFHRFCIMNILADIDYSPLATRDSRSMRRRHRHCLRKRLSERLMAFARILPKSWPITPTEQQCSTIWL